MSSGESLPQVLRCIGLVGLDGNDDLLRPADFEEVTNPHEDVAALLQHHPMIGRQERLTLHAVDDQRVDVLALGDLELDVGWKRRAPEPDHAGFLNGVDDLVGS